MTSQVKGYGLTIQKYFIPLSGVLLWVTAMGKLLSAANPERILYATDPIFLLQYKTVLIFTGVLEFGVACYVFFGARLTPKLIMLNALGASFLLYRALLHFKNPTYRCPCLGKLGDHLPITPEHQEAVLLCCSLILFAGSLSGLFVKHTSASVSVKECGTAIGST